MGDRRCGALQLFREPELVEAAWAYFRDEQTKDVTYTPFIGPDDPPPIYLNTDILARYRDAMRRFYYDETRYDTYLEQLDVRYPTLEQRSDR